MAEYALLIGGVFDSFRTLPSRPVDISHKQITWYPVVRTTGAAFEGLDGDNYRITTPLVEPDPAMTPPRLVAAAFNMTIENGDVTGIEGAFNIIAALYLDVGQYMLIFVQVQPDINYFVQMLDGATTMTVTESGLDYLIIQATEDGAPADPEKINIQIYRI